MLHLPFPFFLAYATSLLLENGIEATLIDAIAEQIRRIKSDPNDRGTPLGHDGLRLGNGPDEAPVEGDHDGAAGLFRFFDELSALARVLADGLFDKEREFGVEAVQGNGHNLIHVDKDAKRVKTAVFEKLTMVRVDFRVRIRRRHRLRFGARAIAERHWLHVLLGHKRLEMMRRNGAAADDAQADHAGFTLPSGHWLLACASTPASRHSP